LKILLDESVPHVVQARLSHLEIRTVQDMGWTGTKKGELLRRAEVEFLSGRTLAIIVLPTNQVRTVVSLLPAIEESLKRVQPGMFLEIPLPE
jgi:hypothetical protein